MEMILHTVKSSLTDVLIEQLNGFGGQPTLLLLLWEIVVVQLEVVAVSSLIELDRLISVDTNFLVIESENIISEISLDGDGSGQIDWRLGQSKLSDQLWAIVGLQFLTLETLQEGDTWSLSSWIREVFRKVILIIVMMSVLAIWSTEERNEGNLA